MTKSKEMTSDLVALLHRRFFRGRPAKIRALAEATLNVEIAQEIYALRTKAGLTQKQLADLIGTTGSAVCRLEDAEYEGHSLRVLQRIGEALNFRLEVRFVPIRAKRKSA